MIMMQWSKKIKERKALIWWINFKTKNTSEGSQIIAFDKIKKQGNLVAFPDKKVKKKKELVFP